MKLDLQNQTRQYLGLYEIEIDRHLRNILRPGVTTFDVGAQHGYDSLAAAKRTGARVAAFEMESECLTRMQESFGLNPDLATLVTPVEGMVGDEPGQLSLDAWATSADGFEPDFLKIDVDGGEASALRSAEAIINRRHPALVVEVHSQALEDECGMFLIDHGYRPIVVPQRRRFPDHRPIPHNRWLIAI